MRKLPHRADTKRPHPKQEAPRLLTTAAHGMRSIPESFFGSFCSQKEQYPPVAKERITRSKE
jgi:hypothetical protein